MRYRICRAGKRAADVRDGRSIGQAFAEYARAIGDVQTSHQARIDILDAAGMQPAEKTTYPGMHSWIEDNRKAMTLPTPIPPHVKGELSTRAQADIEKARHAEEIRAMDVMADRMLYDRSMARRKAMEEEGE